MSTTIRLLHVLSALIVYPTKHEYINSINPFHSMRPCLWSLSNSVSAMLRAFDPNGYTLALPALNFSSQLTIGGMFVYLLSGRSIIVSVLV